MNITELGSIGELVGGVAVIGSLIYLALQVRQTNDRARQTFELERGQANREMSGHFAEILRDLQEPELMTLVQRGMDDWTRLSGPDQGRLYAWVGRFHIHALSAFLARDQGLMDEDFANVWTDWYVSFLKSPGLRNWWEQTRSTHHPGFVDHVESRLASNTGPKPVQQTYTWFSEGA